MDAADLHPERLSDEHQRDIEGFSCGDKPYQVNIADFLRNDALRQQARRQNTTTLFFAGELLAGYVTLVATHIDARGRNRSLAELPELGRVTVPSILIGYLGVDHRMQGQGIGRNILNYCIAEVVDGPIGARLLVVHVEQDNNDALAFWRNQGFVFHEEVNANRDKLLGYLDLYAE